MNIPEIEHLIEETRKLLDQIEALQQKRFGRMNLLGLLGTTHLENLHSDTIAFLLRPDADHQHQEYGELFLSHLKDQGLEINGTKIIDVQREKSINGQRRIDILIQTDCEAIVIENKVFADDLEEQVADYLRYAQNQFGSQNVAVVYLTLDGRKMSDSSLQQEAADRMISEGKLLLAAYPETILRWLQKLTTTTRGEEVLRSAIIQYIDTIEGLCGLREDNVMTKHELVKHFSQKYMHQSRDDFKEVYAASRSLSESMDTVYLFKVIMEIRHMVAQRGHRVYLVASQKRYTDEAEWAAAADGYVSYLGIEVPLERKGEAIHGLAIEFKHTNTNTQLAFGVMGHGQRSVEDKDYGEIVRQANPQWREHAFRKSNYWWTYCTNLKSFVQRIFATDDTEGQDVLADIADNWFSDQTIDACKRR